jgi:hypothetical protein
METTTFNPDIKDTWNERRSPEVLSRFVTRHLAPLDDIEL